MYKYCYSNEGTIYAKGLWTIAVVTSNYLAISLTNYLARKSVDKTGFFRADFSSRTTLLQGWACHSHARGQAAKRPLQEVLCTK